MAPPRRFTPEQLADKKRARAKLYKANLTPEQRQRAYRSTKNWREANRDRVAASTRAWLAANPEKRRLYRERYRARRYGLTPETWQQLFRTQGSKCAICGSIDPRSAKGWHTDHCHASGDVRGILCASCNLILGHAGENPAYLRVIADYLGARND